LKNDLVGENGFVTEPKESWLLEKGSKPKDCPWNAIPGVESDPNEKLEPALLTALNDDVILSTECFRKQADGTETLLNLKLALLLAVALH